MTAPPADPRRTAFGGIYPMLFALFDEQDRLDRAACLRQVEAMVRAGVHGIAVLGLATECNKLSTAEKRLLLDWVAEDLAGRLPLSVTISETSVAGQREFAAAAAAAGAGWVVLQPPPVKGIGESALLRFFGAVADRSPIPVGLQVAPEYLGSGLSAGALCTLGRACANVSILKVEMPPIAVATLIEQTSGMFDVFNGRAGLELPDCVAAGCVGLIPGAECADRLAGAWRLLADGTQAGAEAGERLYAEIAPLITCTIASMDDFLIYAKRVGARRLGLPEALGRPRLPAGVPSAFGLATVDRHSAGLDPY